MIDFEKLPEEMKCDIEEINLTTQLVKSIIDKKKCFTPKEKLVLLDTLSSIEKYMENIKIIETIQECTNQLKNLDDIYSRLQQQKTLKLDLTKYEKYSEEYIEPFVLMWSIGEILDMTTKTTSPSFEKFREYMKYNLLPMVAFQLTGAIAIILKERIIDKAS